MASAEAGGIHVSVPHASCGWDELAGSSHAHELAAECAAAAEFRAVEERGDKRIGDPTRGGTAVTGAWIT
jgi:hypothetical protein